MDLFMELCHVLHNFFLTLLIMKLLIQLMMRGVLKIKALSTMVEVVIRA